MDQSFRIESDTLGEVPVPRHAYWGAQSERARRNFQISQQGIPAPVIRALGLLKGAMAIVHVARGALPEAIGNAIVQAAHEVAENRLDAHFVVDVFQTGSGTSSNMNANEVIANRACELLGKERGSKHVHPNDHVNLAQSSNDVFPTAVHLALALVVEQRLLPALDRLAATWHELADATFDLVKLGRTHLIDAMPIRFGQEFRGYAGHCERGAQRIRAAMPGVLEVPLGGTAVGTGANAPPGLAAQVCAAVERRCGIALEETTNHFQAQSALDALLHCSGALRTFATALFKIANDVRWASSSALAEIEIPVVQPGSSIMPDKVNPVICESVMMLATQVIANDTAVAFANTQGNFQLNTMMPLVARNVVESASLLANGCETFRDRCVSGIQVLRANAERVRSSPILATALNTIVGYDRAARIAMESVAKGETVLEVAAERTGLPAEQLASLLDPLRLCGELGRQRT